MAGSFCYLANLMTRRGAFSAVQALSPLALSRSAFLFDFPYPNLKEGVPLDVELAKRSTGIVDCAKMGARIYFDVQDYPIDLRTSDGMQPVAFIAQRLRQHGVTGVPVTGTIADRQTEYVRTVGEIAARDGVGACLRLGRDDIEDRSAIADGISEALDILALAPKDIDLVLNFEYVGKDSPDPLRTTAHDALDAALRVGTYRNVTLSGTSIPAQLGKRTKGTVLRHRRIELDAWLGLIQNSKNFPGISFGDHGVVEIHHVPPAKVVNVPARVRYTTDHEHIFRRAARGGYAAICHDVVTSADFLGATYSIGDQQLVSAANGNRKFSGGNAVATDMNHHIEFVSAQAWKHIEETGKVVEFALPRLAPRPWLVQSLDLEPA